MQESVDLCRENFRRIINAVEYYDLHIPLGFTVESVSKYQDEFNGSVELYHLLHQEALSFEKRQQERAPRPAASPRTLPSPHSQKVSGGGGSG